MRRSIRLDAGSIRDAASIAFETVSREPEPLDGVDPTTEYGAPKMQAAVLRERSPIYEINR